MICQVTCGAGSGASAAAATAAAAEAPSTARTLVAPPRPAGVRLLTLPLEERRPVAPAGPGSGPQPGRHTRACIATSF
jgi:hypothetical protein